MILRYHLLFFLLPKAVGSPSARISAQTSSYSSYSYPCPSPYFNTSSQFYSFSSLASLSSFMYLFSFLTNAVYRNLAISRSSGLMLLPFFMFFSFSMTASLETALTFMDMPSLRLCCGLLRWVMQARSHLNPSLQTSQKNTSRFLLFLFFYILPTYFQMSRFYYLPMRRLLCPLPYATWGCCYSSLQDLSQIVNFLRPHSSSSVLTVDFGFVLSAISYILQIMFGLMNKSQVYID